MGADLYRKDLNVPILGFERSDRAVSAGYFRDSYNSGSILNQFGLSWWRDITKLQNGEGVITLSKVKKFRKMLADAEATFERNMTLPDGQTGKPFDAETVSYFRDGARLLKTFLDDTIEAKASIEASL